MESVFIFFWRVQHFSFYQDRLAGLAFNFALDGGEAGELAGAGNLDAVGAGGLGGALAVQVKPISRGAGDGAPGKKVIARRGWSRRATGEKG